MSLRAGNCDQPEGAVSTGMPKAAPHFGQVGWTPSRVAPHQEQRVWRPVDWVADGTAEGTGGGVGGGGGAADTRAPQPPQKLAPSATLEPHLVQNMSAVLLLICLVVDVHRLDADASWSSHAREAHVGAAEQPGGQLLELDFHGHG